MERIQKTIFWAVLASEFSHIFCCVLPTVVSILSLMAGLGIFSVMPSGLLALHELIHTWEVPMIITSAAILLMGWGLHVLSVKIDCHNTGCAHEPCGPKKTRSSKLLMIATALFTINVSVYMFVHRNANIVIPAAHTTQEAPAHDHSGHVDHSH